MKNIHLYRKAVGIIIIFVVAFFYVSPSSAQAVTLYWVGAEGAPTSVPSNWSTTNPTSCSVGVTPSGTAPGAADQMNFDADCDNGATIDAGFGPTVNQILMTSGYAGTVTLSNPLTVANTMTVTGGTFTGTSSLTVGGTFLLNNATASIDFQNFSGVDLNGNLTISAGTFNAPSSTMTLAGSLTITNHPATTTFNHNNGIITIDGATNATLNCNNVEFNLVVLGQAGGITKTIGSECVLPLGNNPGPILGTIPLNGTLSGSGTLTKDGGAITMNTGSQLSGFNGLSINQLVINGANLDLSSYATFVANNNVCVGGTAIACTTPSSGSLTLPNGADLNGALLISAGTFNAPSGSMTLAGNLTVSGSPTFNANGGTIIFDGGGGTLNCNNVAFNIVNFSHTSGAKIVNDTCQLPLGNNPTVGMGGSTTLNGATLSGSGTLTSSATFTLSTGATLVGFSGIFANGFTVSGATIDLSGYTTFTTNGINISSGSVTLPNGADINANFTLSGGTFTAPSGTMTLAGNLTINGGTFNNNNGTIIFDGAGGILTCNNVPFHLVAFNNAGLKTVNSNCNLPLGNDPSLPFSLRLHGVLSGTGTLTINSIPSNTTILYLETTGVLSGFSGIAYPDSSGTLTLNGATADLSSYSTVDLHRLTINSGTFVLPPGIVTVSGNLENVAGTFNHNNSTVILDTPLTSQRIDSDFTFYNLTSETTTNPRGINFAPNTTQTILGTLVFNGVGGALSLASLTSGVQWNIDAQGSRVLSGLSVQDSNNINSQVMFATNSVDLGNNTNWYFSDGSAPSFSVVGPQDTSYINNPRPGFKWQAASTTAGGSINNYVLQMDNGAIDGNWELLDIPAYWSGTYVTSKYIASYEGFGDGDPSNNYITVTTQSSTDWGPMENDGQVAEGSHTWYVTVFDTVGNSTRLGKNILMDLTPPTTSITRIPSATLTNATTNTYTTRNRQPVIFGSIVDPLNGNLPTNTIASGPNQVQVTIAKRNVLGLYLFPTIQLVPITETFWTADSGQVNDNFQNTSSKYSPFSFTPTTPFTPGTYQLTINGNDQANNTSQTSTIYLQVR